MTRKRYRLKKKIKNFLIFYSFICVFFVMSYTLSKYSTTTSGNLEIKMAKFHVLVNNVNVTENKPFIINLSPTTNTYNDKIIPNANGYFEITINPYLTEVSLEYEFIFDLSNLDEDFHLTKFVINDGNAQEITDNIIKGQLNLPNFDQGFTENDIFNIKVYWQWNETEDILNPDIASKNIIVNSTIKQKVA